MGLLRQCRLDSTPEHIVIAVNAVGFGCMLKGSVVRIAWQLRAAGDRSESSSVERSLKQLHWAVRRGVPWGLGRGGFARLVFVVLVAFYGLKVL